MVRITVDENSDSYLFKIQDNGIGIEKEKLKYVFERFYRVDEARTSNVAGTGLGLSIVKDSVKALGGDISITSEPGKGTEFIFSIKKF